MTGTSGDRRSPGPWTLQPCQQDHGETTVIVADGHIVCSIPSPIWDADAQTPPGSPIDIETDRANARLILEAGNLKRLLAKAVAGSDAGPGSSTPDWIQEAREALHRVGEGSTAAAPSSGPAAS